MLFHNCFISVSPESQVLHITNKYRVQHFKNSIKVKVSTQFRIKLLNIKKEEWQKVGQKHRHGRPAFSAGINQLSIKKTYKK